MKQIAVLGIACVDVLVKPIASLPEKGQLNAVKQISMHTGGCALNVALDLTKLGVIPRLGIPIGRDDFGEFILEEVKQHGINPDYIMHQSEAQTSASIVFIHPSGERSFAHNTGSNGTFTIADINFSFLEGIDVLLVTGTFLMDQFDGVETLEFLKHAKAKGIQTVLDTAWDPNDAWSKTIGMCLPYIDLFVPSYDEAARITNQSKVTTIVDTLQDMGSTDIIIKLGSDGSYASINNTVYKQPAYKVLHPTDTTGAGDAFVAGVMYALSNETSVETLLQIANAVGAFAVMEEGASSGIPDSKTLFEFIEKKEG